MKIEDLYNLDETIAKQLLITEKYPWEILPKINDFILELGPKLDKNIYEQKDENVWIAKSAKIAPTASIDSILGYKAHMGAGSITSNVKSDKSNVEIKVKKGIENLNVDGILNNANQNEEKIKTNLRKVGAFLGDGVEVGCNSVLNPGTIIGKNTNIYPLSCVRGVIPENSIYKNQNEIVEKK